MIILLNPVMANLCKYTNNNKIRTVQNHVALILVLIKCRRIYTQYTFIRLQPLIYRPRKQYRWPHTSTFLPFISTSSSCNQSKQWIHNNSSSHLPFPLRSTTHAWLKMLASPSRFWQSWQQTQTRRSEGRSGTCWEEQVPCSSSSMRLLERWVFFLPYMFA